MKHLSYIMVMVLIFSASGYAQTTAKNSQQNKTLNKIKAEIDAANKASSVAISKGDSAAVVSLYHPEANLFPPNMEKFTDRKFMGSIVAQFPALGITEAKLEAKELFPGDDTITEVGTYQFSNAGKTIDKGKYIVVWKKYGGTWKMYRDIWNSDLSPGGPQN